MGKPTGFMEIPRETPKRRSVDLRVLDWNEIYVDFGDKRQGPIFSVTNRSAVQLRMNSHESFDAFEVSLSDRLLKFADRTLADSQEFTYVCLEL